MRLRFTSSLRPLFVFVLLLVIESSVSAQDLPNTSRLLRFPAINDRADCFLLTRASFTPVPKDGGIARRLTSGPGYSSFPRFSPDGKQIAFTAQYDGNTEVYVMPAEGGAPKRLTTTATLGRDDISDRMGPNNIVMAWENTQAADRLPFAHEIVQRLHRPALHRRPGRASCRSSCRCRAAGLLSFSPDDSKMAYNRVFREFRTWKHYRGGMADDVWIYDFKTGTTENLTNNAAQDIFPMWGPDNRIYFVSDRDGRMNLFSTDLTGKDTKQLTNFKDYDIKFPSLGKDRSSSNRRATSGATILKTGQAGAGADRHQGGFGLRPCRLGRRVETCANRSAPRPTASASSSVARGDLFSVPAKDGTPRNLTRTSNAHERDAVWSPDGKWIAYNSDETGENELYVRSQDGKGAAAAGHQRRGHLLLPGHLVARQQEAAVGRSLAAVALRRCRQQGGHAGRPGQGRRDRSVRLVARQPVDRLGASGRERHRQGLPLLDWPIKKTTAVTDDWYQLGRRHVSATTANI